ncbi:hypothetical protein V8D89_002957 [Ganoderma adspersum]
MDPDSEPESVFSMVSRISSANVLSIQNTLNSLGGQVTKMIQAERPTISLGIEPHGHKPKATKLSPEVQGGILEEIDDVVREEIARQRHVFTLRILQDQLLEQRR